MKIQIDVDVEKLSNALAGEPDIAWVVMLMVMCKMGDGRFTQDFIVHQLETLIEHGDETEDFIQTVQEIIAKRA